MTRFRAVPYRSDDDPSGSRGYTVSEVVGCWARTFQRLERNGVRS